MAALVRYEMDAWKDDGRGSTSDLAVQPVFNIALPRRWFVTLTSEMKYSFIDGEWFIPIDVTTGAMVSRSTIISLEIKQELYNAYRQYEWAAEFRMGFFF